MIVTAWNNGSHHPSGAGYGVKIAITDRDRFFKPEWRNVILELEEEELSISINIDKKSFWGSTCRELISKDIGEWFIKNGLAPWPKGSPPKLILEPLEGNKFIVRRRSMRSIPKR